MGKSTGHDASSCEFCGRRAEIEVTCFDLFAEAGPRRGVCRFCLTRQNRARELVEGADTVRLLDVNTQKSSTGPAAQIDSLLKVLGEETQTYRSITAAIRVASFGPQKAPELFCAICGETVTPATKGILVWRQAKNGARLDPRVIHTRPCASSQPPKAGCWESLDNLSALSLDKFDTEGMGIVTDVELAWKRMTEG